MIPDVLAGEDLPRAPRQKRSIERRNRLLETARAVFAERGYETASIEEIARRAGAATGALYLYFRSKRQILLVLMNELIVRLSQAELHPQGGGDLRTGLRDFLTRVFATDLEYFGVIRAWQEAVNTDERLAVKQREIEAWTGARVMGVFRAIQQHPKARRDFDVETFARMMDRHFWSLLASGSRMTTEEFAREVRASADVVYHCLIQD